MQLIVASEEDPVARSVAARLGPGEPTDWHVGGSRLRKLVGERFLLRRPGLHIFDERLGEEIPPELAVQLEAVIFPSVHRSESNAPALTVHPIGNLGNDAEVGGRPRELNPVPGRLMTEAFLRWHEAGRRLGLETTFEATHHGPSLRLPSFFIEIGSSEKEWSRADALEELAELLRTLEVDRASRGPLVLGIGGGHYMPRFRDLVRKREVAVAHLVPSHRWAGMDREMVEQLVARSLRVEGAMYARASDALEGRLTELLPEVREKDTRPRAVPPSGERSPTPASAGKG
jgi:D-aminoacyl-tRNA deacylase